MEVLDGECFETNQVVWYRMGSNWTPAVITDKFMLSATDSAIYDPKQHFCVLPLGGCTQHLALLDDLINFCTNFKRLYCGMDLVSRGGVNVQFRDRMVVLCCKLAATGDDMVNISKKFEPPIEDDSKMVQWSNIHISKCPKLVIAKAFIDRIKQRLIDGAKTHTDQAQIKSTAFDKENVTEQQSERESPGKISENCDVQVPANVVAPRKMKARKMVTKSAVFKSDREEKTREATPENLTQNVAETSVNGHIEDRTLDLPNPTQDEDHSFSESANDLNINRFKPGQIVWANREEGCDVFFPAVVQHHQSCDNEEMSVMRLDKKRKIMDVSIATICDFGHDFIEKYSKLEMLKHKNWVHEAILAIKEYHKLQSKTGVDESMKRGECIKWATYNLTTYSPTVIGEEILDCVLDRASDIAYELSINVTQPSSNKKFGISSQLRRKFADSTINKKKPARTRESESPLVDRREKSESVESRSKSPCSQGTKRNNVDLEDNEPLEKYKKMMVDKKKSMAAKKRKPEVSLFDELLHVKRQEKACNKSRKKSPKPSKIQEFKTPEHLSPTFMAIKEELEDDFDMNDVHIDCKKELRMVLYDFMVTMQHVVDFVAAGKDEFGTYEEMMLKVKEASAKAKKMSDKLK